MDPYAVLMRIRELIAELRGGYLEATDTATILDELIDQFGALDRWMAEGGFSPWGRAPGRVSVPLLGVGGVGGAGGGRRGEARVRVLDEGATLVVTFPGDWGLRALYPAREQAGRAYTTAYIERLGPEWAGGNERKREGDGS